MFVNWKVRCCSCPLVLNYRRSIDKEFAEEVLKDLVSLSTGVQHRVYQREVATYSISSCTICAAEASPSVSRPRMIAMYLARKLTAQAPELAAALRQGSLDGDQRRQEDRRPNRSDANLRSVVTTLESHLRQR